MARLQSRSNSAWAICHKSGICPSRLTSNCLWPLPRPNVIICFAVCVWGFIGLVLSHILTTLSSGNALKLCKWLPVQQCGFDSNTLLDRLLILMFCEYIVQPDATP